MKELSLNILDIAENSVKAGATEVALTLSETADTLEFTVSDNGCGMTKEKLAAVCDPFFTSRRTRKVGLGIPLLKMLCEQTGGSMSISSVSELCDSENHGTVTRALFYKNSIDCLPLGDIVSSVVTFIQGSPDISFKFSHTLPDGKRVELDTKELKAVLGDVPLSTPEVVIWIKEFLSDQYKHLLLEPNVPKE